MLCVFRKELILVGFFVGFFVVFFVIFGCVSIGDIVFEVVMFDVNVLVIDYVI